MTLNKKKIGIHVLKVLVAVGILYFVYSKIDNKAQMWENAKGISVFTLISTAVLFAISKLFSSIRLTYFIRVLGVDISQKMNWKLYLQGMFYNLFLPGGIGGDAYKIHYLNKSNNIKTKESFWPFLLDRASGMFSLLILILIFSLLLDVTFIPYQRQLAYSCIALGFISVYVLLKIINPKYLPIFFKTLFLSFLVQLTQVVCIILFLKDLDVHLKFIEYNLLFLVSSIVSIIPVTPGGSGLRELTYKYGVEYFDINESVGILLGSLFFIITLIVSFSGIYYHFKGIGEEAEKL